MNYTKKSFSVGTPGTKEYAENWERTFRRPEGKHGIFCSMKGRPEGEKCHVCGVPATDFGEVILAIQQP